MVDIELAGYFQSSLPPLSPDREHEADSDFSSRGTQATFPER